MGKNREHLDVWEHRNELKDPNEGITKRATVFDK